MTDFRKGNVLNTTPIPLVAGETWRCRYAYGYGLDDSDLPCFFLWPERTDLGHFGVVDCATCDYYNLSDTLSIMANLGLEHFYAAFGLRGSRDLRSAAARALQLDLESITEDCCVGMDVVSCCNMALNLKLKPVKRVKRDVRDSPTYGDTAENATNSPEVSDSDASASSQAESIVDAADCDSDLEDLRDSYASLQTLTAEMSQQRDPQRPHNQEWDFREGRQGLTRFLFLPPAWPLARLLLLLKFVVKQMEALLQNYCFETIATCKFPEQQNQYVYQMGRDLGQLMAIRLAEIVTELMQSVLQHPAKGLWMRVTPPWSKQSTPSYSMPPVASEPGQIKNRSGHRMAWSKFYACLLKGEYKSDMNGGMILYCASKLCLVPVAGWIQCLCGFRLHGCLLWWKPSGPKMFGGKEQGVTRALWRCCLY